VIETSKRPIGIFDSGVGGLSVLKAVNRLLPFEDLIYVADSRFTPYGSKTVQQIEERVFAISEYLITQGVKAVVVACNTATAAAVVALREKYAIPIIGLEPAIKPAIEQSKSKRIGVLATKATLESRKYIRLKTHYAADIYIKEKASPLLVELVETAPKLTLEQETQIGNELQTLKDANIDSLVLGCTHYPFLTKVISKFMGKKVSLFESGKPVAKELKRCLAGNLNGENTLGDIKYYSNAPEKALPIFEGLLDEPVELRCWE